MWLKALIVTALPACLSACVEPYQPSVSADAGDILVVDGSINGSTNSATVKLTRAVALTSADDPMPETNASISIEEFEGGSFPLTEEGAGTYEVLGLPLTFEKKYAIKIQTQNGKIYQSEYVQLYETPAIDSVTWRVEGAGLAILVNTHNESSNSRLYKWNFEETWQYSSVFTSSLIIKGDEVLFRMPSELINNCWSSAPSNTILVGSTKRLTSNSVRDFPLTYLPEGSVKISKTYTILVKQRSLSEEGYTYWQNLRKSTQNVGGLFDPLPAQVKGNITCITDPTEPVLGYFDASSVNEQRIFIHSRDIPENIGGYRGNRACEMDTVLNEDIFTELYSDLIISTYSINGNPVPIGYLTSPVDCADCRLQGGTTDKPAYWQE